jgi:hypothetical protein
MDTTGHDRIRQAIDGEIPWADLDPAEQAEANATLNAAIEETAASTSLGQDLLDSGQDAIGLDEAGALVRHHPDGTSTYL